jgi:hypothetical protein
MRPAAVLKLLSLACAVALAVAFSAPAAYAEPDPECVDECIAQYDEDRAQCEEELEQRLAELDQDAEECYEKHPDDIVQLGMCLRNVNIARYRAQSDYRRCISEANTTAWNCYRNCPPASESAP